MSHKTASSAWHDVLRRVDSFAAKVQPIFAANGWKWGANGVPGVDDIAALASSLAWEALREVEKSGKEH